MSFGDEITQLLLIIVVLGVAYFGITAWVKRGGSIGGSVSGDSAGGTGSAAAGDLDDAPNADLADLGGKRDRHPTRPDGQRFDLTGKDAEAAAKVLKRMLKQDSDLKKH